MTVNSLKRKEDSSLADQIKVTERNRLIRQRRVSLQTDKLVHDIYQQITAPGSLLFAGGIGFILGEMTKKRQTPKFRDPDKTVTPLKSTMSFITSAHTLYSALPLAWLIKSFYQSETTEHSLQHQGRPIIASERASASRDRTVPPTTNRS